MVHRRFSPSYSAFRSSHGRHSFFYCATLWHRPQRGDRTPVIAVVEFSQRRSEREKHASDEAHAQRGDE